MSRKCGYPLRLTTSPACLITDTFGITPALARMYRASGQAVPVGKRTLELNPDHPLVTGLQHAHKAGGDDAQMCRLVETADSSADGRLRQRNFNHPVEPVGSPTVLNIEEVVPQC